MIQHSFRPDRRYLYKLWVAATLIAILSALVYALGILLLTWLIVLDSPRAAIMTLLALLFLDALWWIPAMLLIYPYFNSLRYEIQEDEVVVHVGIFTHSVKHVPYRTITNLTVKQDLLDRWFFKLGSLKIQTAGMSGQTGDEEKLVGLENYQEVYDLVATAMRRV